MWSYGSNEGSGRGRRWNPLSLLQRAGHAPSLKSVQMGCIMIMAFMLKQMIHASQLLSKMVNVYQT